MALISPLLDVKYRILRQWYFDICINFKAVLTVPGISAQVSVRDE